MKLLGDVPEWQKNLAQELEDQERVLDSTLAAPEALKAKMCVCLAHDWYKLGLEEEGNRLLLRADTIFPGYFKDEMVKQGVEDPAFAFLIQSLSAEVVWLFLDRLKSMSGQ